MDSKINFCGMILISVLIICYLFCNSYSNKPMLEHYGATQTEASLSDQLLYNSTQYYNRNKNDFLGKRNSDEYDSPKPPTGNEICPVASWYGDKVWTGTGKRTAEIKTNGVDFVKNVSQYGYINGNDNIFKENSEYIFVKPASSLYKCKKPCYADWKQINNTVLSSYSINNNINDIWVMKPNKSVFYADISNESKNDNFPKWEDISIPSFKLTVSQYNMYFIPDSARNTIKFCSQNGEPCKTTAGQDDIGNVTLEWPDDITTPLELNEIEVNRNDTVMWVITKESPNNTITDGLYKGVISKPKEGELTITFIKDIYDGIEIPNEENISNISELSLSDNYIMAKIKVGSNESYYYKNNNDDYQWEKIIVDKSNIDGLHLTSDIKSSN